MQNDHHAVGRQKLLKTASAKNEESVFRIQGDYASGIGPPWLNAVNAEFYCHVLRRLRENISHKSMQL